jgi:hypothetical protein
MKQLQKAQKQLEIAAKQMIDDPMTDYSSLSELLGLIEKLDKFRREQWNKGVFGEYDQIAEQMSENVVLDFCSDDIPF